MLTHALLLQPVSLALSAEPTMWPSEDKATSWSLALGWTRIYDYEAPENTTIGHHVARVDATVYTGPWMVELDAQWIGVGHEDPSPFVDTVVGYRAYQGPRAPSLWITGDVAYYGSGPAGVLEGRPPLSPGVGIQLQMPLAHLEDGEARWALRWHPLTGLYYKSMHVGWKVGPIGLRIGGMGLRDQDGRLWSGFTTEVCLRF